MPMTSCSASPDHGRKPRRSRHHQEVPARAAQAGTFRDQDPDHPRADAGRPVPRLSNGGDARRRQARPARSPQHQRGDRAESARGRHPRQVRAYMHRGKPIRRTERIVDTDFTIVAQFQAEYRGVAEYYRLASNRHPAPPPEYVMERSLTKTLARKFRISVRQVYRRYRAVLDTGHGPRRGLQVTVDRDGEAAAGGTMGRHLAGTGHHATATLDDDPARIWSHRVRDSPAAPGRRLRALRLSERGRGPPHPPLRDLRRKGEGDRRSGSRRWRHAAARRSSSATRVTWGSIAEAPRQSR